jgi:hypothetical protein
VSLLSPPKAQCFQNVAFFDPIVAGEIGDSAGDFFDAGDAAVGQSEAADGILNL